MVPKDERYMWKRLDDYQYTRIEIINTTNDITKEVRKEVFIQTVEDLNISALILAINNIKP